MSKLSNILTYKKEDPQTQCLKVLDWRWCHFLYRKSSTKMVSWACIGWTFVTMQYLMIVRYEKRTDECVINILINKSIKLQIY